MHDHCPHCGVNFMPEPGFYWASMFVSYGFYTLYTLLTFFRWGGVAACRPGLLPDRPGANAGAADALFLSAGPPNLAVHFYIAQTRVGCVGRKGRKAFGEKWCRPPGTSAGALFLHHHGRTNSYPPVVNSTHAGTSWGSSGNTSVFRHSEND